MSCWLVHVYSVLCMSMLLGTQVQAQETLKKEVHVIKPYEPSLSDAFKLNRMPEIKDTFRFYPSFKYKIAPRPVAARFDPRPIKPAKMVKPELDRYYKSMIKLGIGNYVSPLAELSFNSLRKKDFSYGANLQHYSSLTKIKLIDGNKVPAAHARNNGSIHGKKIFRNVTVEGQTGFANQKYNFYGYNTNLFDTIPEKKDIRQSLFFYNIDASLYSTHNDSNKLAYAVKPGYHYFQDRHNVSNHQVNLEINLNRKIKNQYIGLTVAATSSNTLAFDTVAKTVIKNQPICSKSEQPIGTL
ncbi:MAG: hypothetical protein HC896_04355 [Bacteroidales bacterium]|nr:hypothetical protein [Bacteroidales bacterium]